MVTTIMVMVKEYGKGIWRLMVTILWVNIMWWVFIICLMAVIYLVVAKRYGDYNLMSGRDMIGGNIMNGNSMSGNIMGGMGMSFNVGI